MPAPAAIPARELKKLRKANDAFMERWRATGGKVTAYRCNHCQHAIETRQPAVEDVSPRKGCWDSMQTCTNCGRLNFVFVYPDGRTHVNTVD